jgi:hypothetical protein
VLPTSVELVQHGIPGTEFVCSVKYHSHDLVVLGVWSTIIKGGFFFWSRDSLSQAVNETPQSFPKLQPFPHPILNHSPLHPSFKQTPGPIAPFTLVRRFLHYPIHVSAVLPGFQILLPSADFLQEAAPRRSEVARATSKSSSPPMSTCP